MDTDSIVVQNDFLEEMVWPFCENKHVPFTIYSLVLFSFGFIRVGFFHWRRGLWYYCLGYVQRQSLLMHECAHTTHLKGIVVFDSTNESELSNLIDNPI
jgi:hypothetical protein